MPNVGQRPSDRASTITVFSCGNMVYLDRAKYRTSGTHRDGMRGASGNRAASKSGDLHDANCLASPSRLRRVRLLSADPAL